MPRAGGPPRQPIAVAPVTGIPEVRTGDDLAALLAGAVADARPPVVLVVSSKVVSKAMGLRVRGIPREDVVAAQSARIVAERAGSTGLTRVVESVAGPVMAAAGVDGSNTGEDGSLLVLPRDADAAARSLREGLLDRLGWAPGTPLGVVVSDTAGRPWRSGLTDFALGCAGLVPLLDHRGEPDADGRVMGVTVRALADEVAAAADLVKGKAAGIPAAVVSGLDAAWFDAQGAGARSIVRTGPGDWFAMGHLEAVRAALGAPPGSPAAREVGVAGVGSLDPFAERLRRAVALALLEVRSGAVDVEPAGWDAAMLTCSGEDDLEAGMLLARLLVAVHAEALRATRSGSRVVAVRDGAPRPETTRRSGPAPGET